MNINNPKELSTQLKNFRRLKGLTQTVVAQNVGLNQKTISEIETSSANIRIETLFKIISSLDLEIHLVPKNQINNSDLEW